MSAPTREALLAPKRRWNYKRKSQLCAGIASGLLTLAEAKAAHGLADDELVAWMEAFRAGGARALRMQPPGYRRGRAA